MNTPLKIVQQFVRLIEAKDIDNAIALLAPNVSYENMPMKPVVGTENVRKVLSGFLGPAAQVEWKILSECESGDMVYNERLDRFLINNVWLELPIAGVFQISNGFITLWRDYFDMNTYTTQFAEIMKSPTDR